MQWQSIRRAQTRLANCNPEFLKPSETLPELIRLLTFNVQVGIHTQGYRHYLTRGWQHFLPHAHRMENLFHLGPLLQKFDLVALQEVDGGSIRTSHINQVEFLSRVGRFPFWYQQLNRDLGKLGQHSNGLLSRWAPQHLVDHPLPGFPGRGAIVATFDTINGRLAVAAVHLALTPRGRLRQLSYLRDQLMAYEWVVIMGDMNADLDELLWHSPLRELNLVAVTAEATFPSWKPQQRIDHILISHSLNIESVSVLAQNHSDHRPIALTLRIPSDLSSLPKLSL